MNFSADREFKIQMAKVTKKVTKKWHQIDKNGKKVTKMTKNWQKMTKLGKKFKSTNNSNNLSTSRTAERHARGQKTKIQIHSPPPNCRPSEMSSRSSILEMFTCRQFDKLYEKYRCIFRWLTYQIKSVPNIAKWNTISIMWEITSRNNDIVF